MSDFDELDMRLLAELARDSSESVPVLAERLGVGASVLYSRIRRMSKKGLIRRFTVEVDYALLGLGVRASVGMSRNPKFKEHIRESLMKMPEVVSISEVTGRFDAIVQVVARDLDTLHTVVMERIGRIEGVNSTETFVELQKSSKDPGYEVS
ncbi:MAG: Lrp/AsnC family transcriptional regulator [Nitrosopumilus sp.]|nr:Lrp/AsnC family transcriptional regulator [Nitrosopumilus sp.]CAI9831551.1 Regulatory protein AsnC [Nitrosopumilaceae archaeon]MDA7941884.1 Lrp/AsnC family transcriptional regulator [Nitrosopumilus sp.]MDA7943459.1 Lrp/AsnC family transcriptional regulator [Nitrosopumilus sp.]MDA7945713.1 Lrp/AsnC family transcriptional regulator [Nitrosopumilus sp.]